MTTEKRERTERTKEMYKLCLIAAVAAFGAMSQVTAAAASELVYHPVNPTFGGNPANGSNLLAEAQAQGNGVKSGSQGPDLSGLTNALAGIGASSSPIVIVGGTGGQTNIPTNP
jgi:curli production assembly/transport component CsgF